MKATTRRDAAGALPTNTKTTTTKKKRKPAVAARGFMCGCGGSRSVSVSRANISSAAPGAGAAAAAAAATLAPMKTAANDGGAVRQIMSTAAKTASGYRDAGEYDDDDESADARTEEQCTPSVDSLLQQLRELERGVRALGVRGEREVREDDDTPALVAGRTARTGRPRHRRSATTDSAGRLDLDAESVAVVTESADPLGDFRRSMVQMVEKNGMTGAAELRELLRRFLELNSPRHHHLILRAFDDVWEELFAGGGGLGGGRVVGVAPPPLPTTTVADEEALPPY